MAENFTITFNNNRDAAPDFLKSLASLFDNINNDNYFERTWQGNKFSIEYASNLTFGNILYLSTEVKTSIISIYEWLFQLTQDCLISHKSFHYSEIELFLTNSFRELEKRPTDRFLSRKTVCDFLENEQQQFLDIELNVQKYFGEQVRVYFTSYERSNHKNELLWCSIAKKLDYDEWDMTSMEFIPITKETFEAETSEFMKYWQFGFELPGGFRNGNSITILRNYKFWNRSEYIVLTDGHFNFIKFDVWTDS